MNRPTKSRTKAIVYSCCYVAWASGGAAGANCCPAKGWHKGQRFHPPFVFGGRGNST